MERERETTYRQHLDVSADEEIRLLGGVYSFLLSKHEQRKGARPGAQDGEKETSNDPAKCILPETP